MHEQLNLLNADLDAIIDAIAAEPQPQEQADEAAPRPKYYHIDENTARRAHEMMSMRDYRSPCHRCFPCVPDMDWYWRYRSILNELERYEIKVSDYTADESA